MNKILILLAIIVIIILSMGFYLLNQLEEIYSVQNKNDYQKTSDSNELNIKSIPTLPKTNILESQITLETNDIETQINTNLSDSNNSNQNFKHSLQSKQREETSNNNKGKNRDNSISSLDPRNKKVALQNEKEQITGEEESLLTQLFTFEFSESPSTIEPKVIKVSIQIKTQKGEIGKYSYSATLDGDRFSIIWNTPGWFQSGYSTSDGTVATYNAIKFSNLSILKRPVFIFLTKKIPLNLTFETFDGALIPDGTKIRAFEYDSWIENYQPIITNQKCTLYIDPDQIREIPSLSIGEYCSESFYIDSKSSTLHNRIITLKKKVLFRVTLLEKLHLPIADHYVAITKTGWSIDFPQILEEYHKTGNLEGVNLSFFTKTDLNGVFCGEVEKPGKYFLYIFGPKIQKGTIKQIIVNTDGEKIVVQVDLSTAELKINFFENNKLFQEEIKGNYKNNKNRGTFSTKTGVLYLNQLEPGVIDIHLTSNVFINSTIQFTLPDSGLIEKNMELKLGSNLIGVLNSNGAPILNQEIGLYLYEKENFYYGHQTTTDRMGRFTFTGLNPDITYILNDNFKNYELDKSTKKEYHTSDNEISINLIEKCFFSCLVFDEKEIAVNIKNISTISTRNINEIIRCYSYFDKNKITIEAKLGDTISFCIQTKDFANYYQTIVFDDTFLTNPLIIKLKKGIFIKGKAIDVTQSPLNAGLIVAAIPFEYGYYHSNKVDAHGQEQTTLGADGTFQLENVQIGERFYVLSKNNSPISFTIAENHRHESIELQATKSYSFSGNMRSQNNIYQEGRRIFGERTGSKEYVEAYVDAKGNFFIDCLRPGKWVFTSNFRDMYKVVPRIEIEITDKDETYDWVVFR